MRMSWYNELAEPNLIHLVITKSCFLLRAALRPAQRNNICGASGGERGSQQTWKKHWGWPRVKGKLRCVAIWHWDEGL